MKRTLQIIIILSFIILSSQLKADFSNYLKFKTNNFDLIDNQSSILFAVDEFSPENLEVTAYETEVDTFVKNYSTNFEYSFTYKGVMRGVNISELMFHTLRVNPLTNIAYRLDSISVKYNYNNPLIVNNDYYNSFFIGVVNQEVIESLLSKNIKSNKYNVTQSVDNWFNEELTYYKIHTTKDGIARISHSELINLNSSYIGKKSENFLLYNRGSKVKLYSTSNAVQHGDYFYFVGSHALGDTSYFDFYNGKEPYFFTYNPNEKSPFLKLDTDIVYNEKLSSVYIDNHYEKDKIYGNGFDVTETEQSLCENWYEGELRPPNNFGIAETFSNDFTLFPVDKLNLTFNYASNIFYLPETIRNKTIVNVNNYKTDTINTTGTQVVEREIELNKENLLQGGNTFQLSSYKVVEDESNRYFNGVIGFDYYRINGFVKPISTNDYFSFIYDGAQSKYVEIEGFSDDFVVVIDTINNTIQFPESIESNKLIISSKNNFVSLYLNKQLISDYRYGYYIVEALGDLNRVFYYKDQNQFLNKYNSIDKSKIGILINLENNLSSTIKSTLSNDFDLDQIDNATKFYSFVTSGNELVESIETNYEAIISIGKSFKAILPIKAGVESRKIVNSLASIEQVSLEESKLERVSEQKYDAFYIYHNSLENSINDYVEFMSQQEDKNILAIDVQQLYDTYGHGIESPHSIKSFLKESYDNWDSYPEFLVLFGDATWDPKMLMNNSFVEQMIPTYGIPYSDNFYGTLEGNDQVPEIIIGRVPVNNDQELKSYLEKLKTYYSVPQSPWMKKVLQLAGGDNNQKENFALIMQSLNVLFNRSSICFDTTTIGKTINSTISEDKANEIKESINEGKIWVNFLGHGSPHVIDMSGWEAPNLYNKGKYGILNTMSCNTSAFAEPHTVNSIGEEYVNIADKGFVATIGGTSTTVVQTALSVSTSIFNTLLDSNKNERNLGVIYNSYKPRVRNSTSTLNQIVLLGDPLITVRIPDKPDLAILKKDTELINSDGSNVITEQDDTVIFNSDIYNFGVTNSDSVVITFTHIFESDEIESSITTEPLCFKDITSHQISIENQVGEHTLIVNVDSKTNSNDFDYSNNTIELRFNVFPRGLQLVDPFDYWNVSSDNPVIRFVDPNPISKTYKFTLLDSNSVEVYSTTNPQITNYYIDIVPENLESNNRYKLIYQSKEVETGNESTEQFVQFHTTKNIDSIVEYSTRNWNNELKLNNLKVSNKIISFDDTDYRVNLSSARGSLDGSATRHATISTTNLKNGKEFTYLNRLKRGFNIVVLPSLETDSTYEILHLDTWDSNFDKEDILKHSRWLDRYLRDSLNHGDYLFIATADVPMRAPQIIDEDEGPDSVGSATRIIQVLNDLGAKYADSLDFDASYVLFTRVGYPEMTIDRTTKNDTIQLETTYTRYQESGTIEIPNIGNIRQLISMDIDSDSNNIKSNIDLIDETNTSIINIDNTNSEFKNEDSIVNKNLSAKINIMRDSVGAEYSFNSFNLTFVPVPELAINNIDSKLKDSVAERAVNTMYKYVISNISPRSDARNVTVDMNITNNFNNIQSADEITEIEKNSSIDRIWNIETAELALKNELSINIDSSRKINELFYFNNEISEKLRVREDTTKPYLVAYYNNKKLENGDRVSIKPELVVELFDKSNIEIIKDNVIFARVNRKVVLENTTDTFKFEILNDDDLKARLTFQMTDSLDIGQNVLEVVGEDATGNKADTLEISIYVPGENSLENSINYPNPFSESTTIKYNYIGKNLESEVEIYVYDALGKLVFSENSIVIFGENEFKWDGKNFDGSTTSSGVYFYQLIIKNKANSLVNGKMMKIN